MQCDRCGVILKEEEKYDFHGKTLCEDCYFYETNPPKACDPMAVSTALSIRKQLGQTGINGLTDLQKTIYNTIEAHGRITREELAMTIDLKSEELDRQFAILRHCELIRAFKEGDRTYLTKW